MSPDQKIIKNKVGLLKPAEMRGSVSQACSMMGYSRDSFCRFKSFTRKAVSWRYRKSAAANPV
jgi:hypothetical protein